MIDIKIEGAKELAAALTNASKQLPRETSIAINATSKKVATNMSKQVREELPVKAAELKKIIRVSRKANKTTLGSTVQLDETRRLSLKAYGARQIRKGVSYKISKRGGRKVAPGGFMGPRPGEKAARLGGHAYKRTGASRKPIARLHGPSPWGAYTKNRMRPKTVREGEVELKKQIDRRIRFNVLKRQKLI